MSRLVEPPNSVLLVVGSDAFQLPADFGGTTCIATADCIAIGVSSVDDGPTSIGIGSATHAPASLDNLGTFAIETTGCVSVQSVLGDRYDSLSVEPGTAVVTVWANDPVEPSQVELRVATL